MAWRVLFSENVRVSVRPAEKISADLIGITARPISIFFFLFENFFCESEKKNCGVQKKISDFFLDIIALPFPQALGAC